MEWSVKLFSYFARFSDNLNYFENYGHMQSLQVFGFVKKNNLQNLEKILTPQVFKVHDTVAVNLNMFMQYNPGIISSLVL